MANVVGDIAVSVGADISGLESGLKRGGAAVEGFGQKAALMASRFAKVGGVVAAAAAAATAATAGLIKGATGAAVQIENLSRIAGASPREFQRMAIAAENVGMSHEKLADILKDVNDKFGDFLVTGQGPLKDFFEQIAPQVGVTADQFARLSGPEALQLYVSSLEKANLTQAQMTFFMEAIASDATALIPLLRDNGAEMQRLGDAAERNGRVMSDSAVRGGAELDRKMQELGSTLRDNLNRVLLENEDNIRWIAEAITDTWIPALISVAGYIAKVVEAVGKMVAAIARGIEKITEFGAAAAESFFNNPDASGKSRKRTPGINTVTRAPVDPDANDPRAGIFGDFSVTPPAAPMSVDIPPPAPFTPISTDSRGGGGGGNLLGNLEQMRQALASQDQLLGEWRMQQLEKLREFREAKLITEEEFNQLEAEINRQHVDAMAELDRRSQRERLNTIGSAFGDLASLMQTGSGKLFKIGKAAAIAEATVSGYQAAVDAWAKGMKIGGPPVAAAFTAASLARTGAMISAISRTSASGGGGGATSAGIAAASGPAVSDLRTVELSIVGDGIEGALARSLTGRLIPIINEEIKNGGRVDFRLV